ncbi:MAG: metallophosphoesterase family protein [Anaerolineales bacterium]
MRILVISDIHANLTALEAVLEAAGSVDATWCLGDLVGYGPDPNECIELVRSLPSLVCLLGNHDAAATSHISLNAFNYDARLSVHWLRGVLKPQNMSFLAGLPEKYVTHQVTLTHGSPRNPVWEYLLDTHTAAFNFDFFDTHLCFVGHSHVPLAYLALNGTGNVECQLFNNGDKLKLTMRAILNPGSVGQPRDHDPRASYAIFDPEEMTWELHRVEYDVLSVQQRINSLGLPRRHAIRLAQGW